MRLPCLGQVLGAKQLLCVPAERFDEQLLWGAAQVIDVTMDTLCADRQPQHVPTCCAIAGAFKALRINECLQDQYRMGVALLPVCEQPLGTQTQNARGKVRLTFTTQDQKATILRYKVKTLLPLLLCPTYPAVAILQSIRGGTKHQQRQPLTFFLRDIQNRFPDRLAPTQVVFLVHQSLKTSPLICSDRPYAYMFQTDFCFHEAKE